MKRSELVKAVNEAIAALKAVDSMPGNVYYTDFDGEQCEAVVKTTENLKAIDEAYYYAKQALDQAEEALYWFDVEAKHHGVVTKESLYPCAVCGLPRCNH